MSDVFLSFGNGPLETALAGWGGRIRTAEWRNQHPPPAKDGCVYNVRAMIAANASLGAENAPAIGWA
jgi:hypothetical protein